MGKSINKNVYLRDVLLSTGEFSKEVVIQDNEIEVFESCPVGTTLGNNEASIKTIDQNMNINQIDFGNILDLSQEKFDKIISANLNSQISTALSLAHFRYLSSIKGFSENNLFKFISKYYKTKRNFPIPIFNILNGGKHVGNSLAFCEFMIIPYGKNFKENIRIGSEIYQDLKNIIMMKHGSQNALVGIEGGIAPNISDVEYALGLISDAIKVRNSKKCFMAIDVAANSFSEKKLVNKFPTFNYYINNKKINTYELYNLYTKLIKKFPEIIYLEDPFNEEDQLGWGMILKRKSGKLMIVGDDLTVTNLELLKKYKKNINSCILKINQVGNLSETVNAFKFCKDNNIKTIISQRSGETDSDFISHLAVGLGSDYIKAGAPARERIVKYNSLIRIFDSIK